MNENRIYLVWLKDERWLKQPEIAIWKFVGLVVTCEKQI